MIFSNTLQSGDIGNLKINDTEIEHASSVRFLGVIIDEKLKFNEHTCHISKKISQNCGVLYKLQSILPQKTLLGIYRSFVECYLNYCVIIFRNSYKNHILPLK